MSRFATALLLPTFLTFLPGGTFDAPPPEATGEQGGEVRVRADAGGEPLPRGAVGRLGSIRVWRGEVRCIAFSPDGRLLAAGGDDRLVRVWDVRTGRERQVFPAHRQLIRCLAFSPDGKMLAVGGGTLDTEVSPVLLWDVATGREVRRFKGHSGEVNCLAFSPDGKLIATGSGNLLLFDVATGKEVPHAVRGFNGAITAVAFSPDGRALVCSGGPVLYHHLKTGKTKQLPVRPNSCSAVAFTPDGKAVATAGIDPLRLWSVATGKESYPFGDFRAGLFTFLPNGQSVAMVRFWPGARGLLLGDPATGKFARPLEGHQGGITCLACSPDGRLIASGSEDGTVLLWDATGEREVPPRRFTLSAGEAIQAAARASANRPIPRGAKVTLGFDKEQFFLGENVLAHFRVENAGAAPFHIDLGGAYRGANRHQRFRVKATDEKGAAVPDPYPNQLNFGGLSWGKKLKPGEKYFASLRLVRYLRFEKPGTYRVRVWHDFGWRSAGREYPVAEATIKLVMPTPEQAKKVIEEMDRLPKEAGGTPGEKREPFADFSALAYPVYVPLLAPRAREGDERALQGLASIPTPEATAALVKLLGHKDTAFARKVLEALKERLPHPRLEKSYPHDERWRWLVKQAWRSKHAPAVRKAARRLLGQKDLQDIQTGADVLEGVGRQEEVPALAAALDQVARQARRPAKDDAPYPRPRDVCQSLMYAARLMCERGARPPAAPGPAGELLLFAAAVDARKDFRPAGWEEVYVRMLRHELPFVRVAGLNSLPLSLPKPLLEQVATRFADLDPDVRAAACRLAARAKAPELREPVLRLLATAREEEVFRAASGAAASLAPPWREIEVLVSRLDEEGMTAPCLDRLTRLVLANESGYGYNRNEFDAAVGRACKAAWQRFLREHGAKLKAGKQFSLTDPSLPLKELFPKFEFSPPRGG